MSAEVAVGSRTRGRATRLQREATEVEAAIALVAHGAQYRVLLCGLRYGGPLAASLTAQAAAAGVCLEPVRRDRSMIDIRVRRA
jgi:hypothetical protein